MNDEAKPDSAALLNQLLEKMKSGELPDLGEIGEERKAMLIRIADCILKSRNEKLILMFLDALTTERRVKGAILAMQIGSVIVDGVAVLKFFGTVHGLIVLAIAAAVLTGKSPIEIWAAFPEWMK